MERNFFFKISESRLAKPGNSVALHIHQISQMATIIYKRSDVLQKNIILILKYFRYVIDIYEQQIFIGVAYCCCEVKNESSAARSDKRCPLRAFADTINGIDQAIKEMVKWIEDLNVTL